MKPPAVSVVIVSYNSKTDLNPCLRALEDPGNGSVREVIVVDNASDDGTPDMVESHFPGVRLIRHAENLGYSRGVNRAIREAGGEFVLVLNPDVRVTPGSVDALAAFLERTPEAGIAGGKLLNEDGSLQHSCRTFYTLRTLLHRRTILGRIFPDSRVVRDHLMLDWDHETMRDVDWMLGACLMVRVDAIREVGWMDERFFMYFEDVDWCYRMKQQGWRVVYVPEATMHHIHRRESASGGGLRNRRLVAHLNSMFRFFDKWNTRLYSLRRNRDPVLAAGLLAMDLVAVNVAFLGAFHARRFVGAYLERPVFPLEEYGAYAFLLNGVVLLVNGILGLYRHPTSRNLLDDAFDLARGLAFATLILMASTFLTKSALYSRFMVAAFVPQAFLLMTLGRWGAGAISGSLRRSRFDLTRVVVLGEKAEAENLAERLSARPEAGYDVVAALGDGAGEGEPGFADFWNPDGVGPLIRRHRVGEVLVVHPTLADSDLARLILLFRREGVRVRVVSGVADFLPSRLTVSTLVGRPVVDLGTLTGRSSGVTLRRVEDMALAIPLLLLLGPLGWFRAARSGREGDPTYGYRGEVFLMRRGRTRFDQLAESVGHVLRGNLAFVGPRPVSPEEVTAEETLPVLFDVVRPGVTGAWRTHGEEGLSLKEEVSLSLSNLQNQSPVEDLKILLKTLCRRNRSR
ncbi:MAG: glycosyltransferase [Gemmatimonadota bacterium]|nr:glycosyltransferase [Gemmatimonadota bacterium]